MSPAPFHDQVVPLRRQVPVGSIQGTLALDLAPRHEPPRPGSLRSGSGADVVPIERGSRARVEQWAWRYAQAAVEIAGADRPVAQLLRWTDPEVYADLARRAQLVARAAGQRAGSGTIQPVRPVVHGVHCCFVHPEVVEVSAHVKYGRRSRAVALRFEFRNERWQCTALEFA